MNHNRPLVHPNMTARDHRFFPQKCTIWDRARDALGQPLKDDHGQPTGELERVAGLSDLSCYMAASRQTRMEIKRPDGSVFVDARAIQIDGYYPAITSTMVAEVGDVLYDVLNVRSDAQGSITMLDAWEAKR